MIQEPPPEQMRGRPRRLEDDRRQVPRLGDLEGDPPAGALQLRVVQPAQASQNLHGFNAIAVSS